MGLGDSYATLSELKAFANATKDTHDALLTDALVAASRGIELVCHRQFNDAVTPSARLYRPLTGSQVKTDDFHTTTGLIVKTDSTGTGVFDTTWTAGSFEARPLNGIVSGQPGWPYYELWSDGTLSFPTSRLASVEVTARWGWAEVPKAVKQVCLMMAEELYKIKDAPWGVAGNTEYGVVRVRENPMAMKKLAPYIRFPVAVA